MLFLAASPEVFGAFTGSPSAEQTFENQTRVGFGSDG
jgi:hypothetical protein